MEFIERKIKQVPKREGDLKETRIKVEHAKHDMVKLSSRKFAKINFEVEIEN